LTSSKTGTIERFDQVEELGGVAGLVRLQLADQVELSVRWHRSGELRPRVLYAVFAEPAEPKSVGGVDGLTVDGLRDGDDRDGGGWSAGPFRRLRDGPSHAIDSIRESRR